MWHRARRESRGDSDVAIIPQQAAVILPSAHVVPQFQGLRHSMTTLHHFGVTSGVQVETGLASFVAAPVAWRCWAGAWHGWRGGGSILAKDSGPVGCSCTPRVLISTGIITSAAGIKRTLQH